MTKNKSEILLPELGEGIEKAVVACWYAKPGDWVKEGDDVVELVTDKATFNVSATKAGQIKSILVPEGQEAKIGQLLAVVE